MKELVQKIGINSDIRFIIYGVIGIFVLYIVIRFFKLPLKLLLNGIFGVVLLYIVNLIGANYGIQIGINIITALIAGTLGIPGVIALILFKLFL